MGTGTIDRTSSNGLAAWLEIAGSKKGPERQAFANKNLGDSVQLVRREDSDGSCPGIVVLHTVNPDICNFIAHACHNGTGRILAVVANRSALAGDGAWKLLKAGASDVLVLCELSDPSAVILARLQRWQKIDRILELPLITNNLVGQSRVWRSALRQLVEVALFTDAPVLLTGETGTGKELAARLIHTLDPKRSPHELVILDCTTIVPELSGSELFGHEKGAFTGSIGSRDGAFAMADHGTVFLDEVGELPGTLQIQLLRVLQEQTYKRVGSNTWRRSDFRLICATNRNLQEEVGQGRFRRDLFYRIASHTIHLPALQERIEDVRALVCHFLQQAQPDGEIPPVDKEVWRYFEERSYTGNVRDLRNLVFRIMTRHVGPGPITVGDIASEEYFPARDGMEAWHVSAVEPVVRRAILMGIGLREIKRLVEDVAIQIAIDEEQDNLQAAATRLGVTDRTLQGWRARKRQLLEEPSRHEQDALLGSDRAAAVTVTKH